MSHLKLQTQVSLDGYLAGPNREMDWMSPFSDDMGAYIGTMMASVRHLLLGRRLAEGFIPHWAARPEFEPEAAITFMNETPKVVISRTLTDSPWPGVELSDDLVGTVARLKAANDGDDIAYGGGELVASLVQAQLVDELHLFVHPVSLGAGMPVFGTAARRLFVIEASQVFDNGVMLTRLTPRPALRAP